MSNSPDATHVRVISTETIKPAVPSKTRRLDLTPWDLSKLSLHYIQKGHVFSIRVADIKAILARLKSSFSLSLVHFFPLAGRFASTATSDGEGFFTYVDCGDQGAEFTHAVADGVTVADVLPNRADVPHRLTSRFFAMDSAVNHDGHTSPLLAIQVTELVDGIVLGCSFNHAIADGTSYWHFFNTWAEICRNMKGEEVEVADDSSKFINNIGISRPPVFDRLFLDGRTPIRMPFRHPDEFLERFRPHVELRERFFHFSKKAMAALKARTNSSEYCISGGAAPKPVISSFQSLCALLWRIITRARHFPQDQITKCCMAAGNRKRLQPYLSEDYFGNSVSALSSTTTSGELLGRDLGWAALLLNRVIVGHTDQSIRDDMEQWTAAPTINHYSSYEPFSIMISSSPLFNMYGCDFGWGKALAVRSGAANKFDGKVMAYPGREGDGSVDMEICLAPQTMSAFERDEELIDLLLSLQNSLPPPASLILV